MTGEVEKAKTEVKNIKNTAKGTVNRVKIAAPYAYVEELVVSSPNERNWRGIFIALLVIVAVLGLIVFSIVLVSPPEEGPRVRGKKPTLEDIFIKLPPTARFNGTWISGSRENIDEFYKFKDKQHLQGDRPKSILHEAILLKGFQSEQPPLTIRNDSEFVYRDAHGGVTLYNAENLTTKILMTNSTFRQYNAVDFKISNDLKFVLLIKDARPVNEHATLARYYIYERTTRFKKTLSPQELDKNAPLLQYAVWSPDSSGVAFVHNNDIYYKPKVQKDLVCRITKTGRPDIYNGIPDWLYENEILKTSHALWFSPDSQYLLYLTFNDSLVGEYKYPWYDSGNPNARYPTVKSIRYPKVETPNPDVSVWIVNLKKPKYLFPIEIKPTGRVEPGSYVTSAAFYDANNVAVIWLNRRQNVSVIVTCKSANNFNCTDFHIERESKEPIFHPVFSANGAQALVRLPVEDGDNGHYMHACQLYLNNVIPLTHGAFELSKILAWDEENHLIYALATNENAPGVRHLFKIGDTNSSQPWTCLTCQAKLDANVTFFDADFVNETVLNATMLADHRCDYNNIIFSTEYRYYVQECLGPDVPVVFLVETATNVRLAVLNPAKSLRNRVKGFSAPRVKKIQVEIEFGFKAQVNIFFPPILREYEDVAFPLILLVDAEPGSQAVSSEWSLSWPWYLASTRNYVVAQIDARGSGFQGERMRREIYHKIGTTDVQDQLAILTYLRDTFRFIDRTKICAFGKGYGGYVSAMMLLQDIHQVVNCSVSVSPITNWKFYNSYFTEKYLGLPSKNPQEYDNADMTIRAGNLKNRRFLLIHGTADTTVLPQHSLMFARSLIDEEVLFQQLVYPDESHKFSRKTLLHMYKEIDQFFNDSFGPVIEEWDDGSSFFIQ